jgi:hypothetical protein
MPGWIQALSLKKKEGPTKEEGRIARFLKRSPNTKEVFAHELTNWSENLVVVVFDEDDDEEQQYDNHQPAKVADTLDNEG